MKNRLIIFLSLFILLGCSSQKNTTSYSKKQYNEYVSYYNRLKMSTSFDESCDDCSIQLITNKISNKKIRYDIIINNPVIEMKNIILLFLCLLFHFFRICRARRFMKPMPTLIAPSSGLNVAVWGRPAAAPTPSR